MVVAAIAFLPTGNLSCRHRRGGPFDAAPLTCAGVTRYKAEKVSGTRPTNILEVFGVGGLGHMAIQYVRIAGTEVVAVDVDDTSAIERLIQTKEFE